MNKYAVGILLITYLSIASVIVRLFPSFFRLRVKTFLTILPERTTTVKTYSVLLLSFCKSRHLNDIFRGLPGYDLTGSDLESKFKGVLFLSTPAISKTDFVLFVTEILTVPGVAGATGLEIG